MATTSSNANGAPLSKTESYSASKSAMAAIFGSDHKYAKDAKEASTQSSAAAVSSTSPTSAPPDARAQSGVEPPSGIQGAGTATEPYDQGNAPENVAEQTPKTVVNGGSTTTQSKTEPLSGVQGKGTQDEPFDQGNSNGMSFVLYLLCIRSLQMQTSDVTCTDKAIRKQKPQLPTNQLTLRYSSLQRRHLQRRRKQNLKRRKQKRATAEAARWRHRRPAQIATNAVSVPARLRMAVTRRALAKGARVIHPVVAWEG